MQRKYFRLGLAAATFTALTGGSGTAAADVSLQTVVSGLSTPLYVTNAGDARLFIVERPGRIRVYTGGALVATPVLDVSSKTTNDGERGLLSVAFHPDFATNGYFFVDYTNTAGNIVVERYTMIGDPHTSNVADPTSAATLLVIPHPTNNNHNGGQLQIGPTDGYLYIGTGDGGGAGDTPCNAERTDVLLGKILRVDVRQNLNTAPFYGIPPSNPFTGSGDPGGQIPDEIWAIGLRNPWRFSFDRVNGDMYIGDVGQDSFEEVDVQKAGTAAGRNYGWKSMEGLHCFNTTNCPPSVPACNSPAITLPVHEYPHGTGDCSVTGGYRYRGSAVPSLIGKYLFGDYCSGSMRTLSEVSPGTWQMQPFLSAPTALTSFGEGANGELYATIGNDVVQIVSSATVPVASSAGWRSTLATLLPLLGLFALRCRPTRRRAAA